MNRESIDKQTRHVSDVQRTAAELDNLSPDERDERIKEETRRAVDRWELCNNSFKMLFEALNSDRQKPIDLFDIRIDGEELSNKEFDEYYLRVWKEKRDNSYRIRPLVRKKDGNIVDFDFDLAESFGDTYNYRFGTTHSHSAKIKMQNVIGGGIKLERKDGYLVDGVSQYETAVLISAIDNMILPSIEKVEDTLLILWESAISEELNPVLSQKVRAYFQNK